MKPMSSNEIKWTGVPSFCKKPHETDSDCTVGPDGLCVECGVDHTGECPECCGRGFHKDGCIDAD